MPGIPETPGTWIVTDIVIDTENPRGIVRTTATNGIDTRTGTMIVLVAAIGILTMDHLDMMMDTDDDRALPSATDPQGALLSEKGLFPPPFPSSAPSKQQTDSPFLAGNCNRTLDDGTWKSLFIGNIPFSYTEARLKEILSECTEDPDVMIGLTQQGRVRHPFPLLPFLPFL